LINDRIRIDAKLREALERYDTKARTHGVSHFGLRYPSFAGLEVVLDRLERDLPGRLIGRVTVNQFVPATPGA